MEGVSKDCLPQKPY